LRRAIELLEIEHGPRSMIGEKERLELIEETRPETAVREQRPDSRRVNLPIGEILHDREDQRPVGGRVDHRSAIAVGEGGKLVGWTGNGHPYWREPVEVANMPLQRGDRAFVPRCMEADIQWFVQRRGGCGCLGRADLAWARRLRSQQPPNGQIDLFPRAAEQARGGRPLRRW